tara:strand:- start:700636 stop:701841 length:1206 start_codon:yes stop_codon:yes gene_type:complete
MILEKISHYWHYGDNYCGIEVTTWKDSDYIKTTLATKKKGEFTNFSFKKASNFKEVSKKLPKKQHANLIISTDKVLIKKIKKQPDETKALSEAFPGLQIIDFQYDILHFELNTYVAVCRKDIIDNYVIEAEKEGLRIVHVGLAFFSITTIINFVEEPQIYTGFYKLELNQDEIVGFSKNQEVDIEYNLGGNKVQAENLLSLSGLFLYFKKGDSQGLNLLNKSLYKKHSELTLFSKGSKIGVIVLFIFLLINFILFSHYRGEYNKLSEVVKINALQKEKMTSQIINLEGKERLVNDILRVSSSKGSYYINKLTSSSPKSILFEEISYQPILKTIRSDKKIEIDKKAIKIVAECTSKDDYSKWVEKIEYWNWIQEVTVINYNYLNSGRDKFELKIIINNDSEK